MNLDGLELPGSPLHQHEVYFAHDGPRLFALKSDRWPMFYVVNCVEEDEETGTLTFLCVLLDEDRFLAVRGGAIDLRTAYVEAEVTDRFVVVLSYESDGSSSGSVIRDFDLPERWLPRTGAAIQLPTDSARAFETEELERIGQSSLRSVAAVELGAEDVFLTEFPLRSLSRIGAAVQDNLDALAEEELARREERGRGAHEVQMSVLGLRAASFVVVLGTDKRGRLTERSELITRVLDEFSDLVQAGSEDDDGGLILERLRGHGPRARGKFKQLLRHLADVGSGLAVHAAPLGHDRRSVRLSQREVARSLEIVSNVPSQRDEIHLRRATLTALNLTRRSFELWDLAQGKRYSGFMTPEARDQADGLRVSESSFVTATVLTESSFAAEDDDATKHTLISIAPLSDA